MFFADWAQTNPLNARIRVASKVPQLLIPLQSKEYTSGAYCFELKDSDEFPVIMLPFTTPLSSRMRIEKAREIVERLRGVGLQPRHRLLDLRHGALRR
jgi:hypothetical protein